MLISADVDITDKMETINSPCGLLQQRRLVVGISGVTCGGKTTVAKLLKATFPWASVIHQDAYFHPNEPEYHVFLPEINYFNWELDTALDFKKMEADVFQVLDRNGSVAEVSPFFHNSQFVSDHTPRKEEVRRYENHFGDIQLVIIEGHIIFNRQFLDDNCDLKFFLTLDKDECWERRQLRNYEPQPPPQFFDYCVWPSYSSRYKKVQDLNKVTYIDASKLELVDIYRQIKSDILYRMTTL